MLIMLAESRSLRRKLVRHPVDAGLSSYALVNDEKPGQRNPEDMHLVCEGVNADDDAFAFRGYVAYANELFGVSMRVHKNGDVEMLDDDPLGRIVRLH